MRRQPPGTQTGVRERGQCPRLEPDVLGHGQVRRLDVAAVEGDGVAAGGRVETLHGAVAPAGLGGGEKAWGERERGRG